MPDQMTPAAWLEHLEARLDERNRRITRYLDYRAGNHRLAFATSKYRETFGAMFGAFADNWCKLIVEASVERLRIEGFRFSVDDQQADRDAWQIWQANNLDAKSTVAHREAITCEEAYALVAPPRTGSDIPVITVEHPTQVIVETAEDDDQNRLAALKRWLGTDGHARATLYLPGAVHRFRSKEKEKAGRKRQWVRLQVKGMVPLDIAEVPLIPLRNNPTMLEGGQSDLDVAIPLQDAITKEVLDMIVASEFGAFRQRWASGIEIPNDPVTGKPMSDVFTSGASRLLTVPNPDVKFGEFEASDLGNYVKAIEMLVQHLAAQTRTPPHYLLGQSGSFPSGESLKSTETGLVAKVKDKQTTFGEGWEEVMRLAFRYRGDETRGRAIDAETIWRDPESRTWGELVDGLVKLKDIGVPQEMLWERAGFSQQEINRMKAMQEADAQRLDLAAFSGNPADQGMRPEPVELDAGVT